MILPQWVKLCSSFHSYNSSGSWRQSCKASMLLAGLATKVSMGTGGRLTCSIWVLQSCRDPSWISFSAGNASACAGTDAFALQAPAHHLARMCQCNCCSTDVALCTTASAVFSSNCCISCLASTTRRPHKAGYTLADSITLQSAGCR